MSQRSFGSDIGNKTTMTASNSSADGVSLVKHATPSKETSRTQMEKPENGAAVSRLPKALAIEVYTKIHNSTLPRDDLLDEIEDLVDEKYFVGEVLLNSGNEYVVKSSERKGGLTLYTMEDGSKIGHRDLRRKKGLSVEEIKQIAIDDVILVNDKTWKVKKELLEENPLREPTKFAAIFNTANKKATSSTATSSSSPQVIDLDGSGNEEEEGMNGRNGVKEENGERNGTTPMRRAPRASGGPATSASRRLLDKKREKEAKDKERMEKLKKEKEDKQKKKEEETRKKEEEKAKKQREKEEKSGRKSMKNGDGVGGSMDRFVKKEDGEPAIAGLFSPSKWSEKRTAVGVKKLDDAWKKRDLEAFNEACLWCEKNLSGNQRNSFDNPIYKFAVQKLVDKTKDKASIKGMKWAKKAEYKLEMAEKRKPVYSIYEPQIRKWFSDEHVQDDLLVTGDKLEFVDSRKLICDEELLKCLEIAQYFVSMRKILLWNENISAEQLKEDLYKGLEGFRRSTYKMIANLFETAIQEKEHEKVAHCNARLSEFPITEHTISELVRAFFVGNEKMSNKKDCAPRKKAGTEPGTSDAPHEEEDVDEDEEMESEEKPVEPMEDLEEEKVENPENLEENQEEKPENQQEIEELNLEDSEDNIRKLRVLSLFTQFPGHIYDWAPGAQLEVLYSLKELVHGLPIIREWYLRDANTDQLTGLKAAANKIAKKIEELQQQLSELPSGEITDEMTRHQTREMEKVIRKRQQLEKQLDDLKDELEDNREEAARQRDDLERIYRIVSIGTDRHLRKYYWFAYSSDAGIWIQDFGTTAYEKWVRNCYDNGFMDVESLDVPNRPEYQDLPLASAETSENWYKIDTEAAVRSLLKSLKKNGKREKPLHSYIKNNLDDILASIKQKGKLLKKEDNGEEVEEDTQNTDDIAAEMKEERAVDDDGMAENPAENADDEPNAHQQVSRFNGPFGALKQTMSDFLGDWKQSGITKIGDVQVFETRLDDANTLDEMKRLVIELSTSIPKECLIERFPTPIAFAKKCHSHLKMNRFCRRVQEAINPSCLHLLLAYFDARIDQKKTLQELPCQVCRRKNGTTRKLMCKQCAAVYHHNCHRPVISRELFEEDGFKEGWWCAKCTKEDRRRQLIEAKEQREKDGVIEEDDRSGGSDNNSDDEEEEEERTEEEEEEIQMSRGRSAKRKANAAMRDVLEFEGVLRHTPAPPPPKRKRTVVPEVQELYNSIEKANPRLYKMLQMVPAQSRSTRNSHHETRSLMEIEEDLDHFKDADQLMEMLKQFFQQARGYVETHNPRKLDELESLISELNLI